MSETQIAHGHCLCGRVGITAGRMSRHLVACHCGMCRKWGGGPFMAVSCGTDVTFSGEAYISTFRSSEWAERGFCRTCGTHLFYRRVGTGHYEIPVGLFDDADIASFTLQIFTERQPDYYAFANRTRLMTEEEVLALCAPSEGQ
ncbi:GFA family protein [Salmonella enterica subsp. enterica serovar Morehead]|nr:GFA family protein [Salmonella enterica subsp. enterica serovar Morehead]